MKKKNRRPMNNMNTAENHAMSNEKMSVALTSVIAAVALTLTKITIGLWTNSLGILSEAAHSGLDLIAATMTLYAVKISSRPADEEHLYGHGKIENLSALFETLLLLATCGWIIWEAVSRLLSPEVIVKINIYSFLVILMSIAVDYSRSRALLRVAKKYQSQALEADALHFSTDIWSSLVVLLGLCAVGAGNFFNAPWLAKADSAAALGVAFIVLGVCWRLAKKSTDDLLDRVPGDMRGKIRSAAKVEGVENVKHVRVRKSGPEIFADVTLIVRHDTTLETAHKIADCSEAAIKTVFAAADVIIHVEPAEIPDDILTAVRIIAGRKGLQAHSMHIYEENGQQSLDLHIEVNNNLRLREAHELANEFEKDLIKNIPRLANVVTHIEPDREYAKTIDTIADEKHIAGEIGLFLSKEKLSAQAHDIKLRATNDGLALSFHCSVDADIKIDAVHKLTAGLEKHLRSFMPELKTVTIHAEPPDGQKSKE